MVATVGQVLRRVKGILQEFGTGIRWTDAELLDWLNEGYLAVMAVRPDAASTSFVLPCVAGTRQSLPAGAHRLLSVVRNMAEGAGGMAIQPTVRAALDVARRGWHSEPGTVEIEQFMYDEADPHAFYVYPPALAAARLEIIYAAAPEPHAAGLADTSNEALRFADAFAPALTDYVLFRAFSKDAEGQANQARAQLHYGACMGALGGARPEVPA